MRHQSEIDAILKQVELWPAEELHHLASRLREVAIADDESVPREQRRSFADLLGIANPEGRAFTNEEVDALRFEALQEKYHL